MDIRESVYGTRILFRDSTIWENGELKASHSSIQERTIIWQRILMADIHRDNIKPKGQRRKKDNI